MSSSRSYESSSGGRIAGLTLTLFLSVFIPFCVVYSSLKTAFEDKPLRAISSESDFIGFGNVNAKDGELWFQAAHTAGDAFSGPFEFRIKKLDLRTGIESETGIATTATVFWPTWSGDELFLVNQSAVCKVVGNSCESAIAFPARSLDFWTFRMLSDAQVSTIAESDEGGFRLMHLDDGKWIEGRSVRLPGADHTWERDPETGRAKLISISSPSVTTTTGTEPPIRTIVRQFQATTHILVHEKGFSATGFKAYRNGFEFDQEPAEYASALTPENVEREFVGWEPIPPISDGEHISSFGCDRDGAIIAIVGSNRSRRILRRIAADHWIPVTGFGGFEWFGDIQIVTDTSDGQAYLIDSDLNLSFSKIYQIRGDSILPYPIVLRRQVDEYLGRWRQAVRGLVIGWLIHLLIWIVGGCWIIREQKTSLYEFGNRSVKLASILRRAMACLIDVTVCLLSVVLLSWIAMRTFHLEWKATDTKDLCHFLWWFEKMMTGPMPGGGGELVSSSVNVTFFVRCMEQFHKHVESFVLIAMTAVILVLLKIVFEGQYGVTPGKWLLGIRTMSATLRPCGVARSLLRNLLNCVDFVMFVTPIPALISIGFSNHKQRLADRFADTIVIDAKSLLAM